MGQARDFVRGRTHFDDARLLDRLFE